jgi:ATP-dependent DNA helicase RecG
MLLESPRENSVENADGQSISITWQQILTQRGCLKWVGGKLSPTYAALLMFGKAPQQWLPNTTILAIRFSGKSMSDQFIKQEIRGPLPQQLRMAEIFLKQNIRSVVRMDGLMHTEQMEYPFEAVREVLVNAVAHRDYNLQGDIIHLHLFSDRLEVQSPGILPGPVTLSNLLNARFARNPIITQLLADLGFVERLGYGLDRVVTAMAQQDLPAPHFEETAGRFTVTLYNNLEIHQDVTHSSMQIYMQMDLNPRQLNAIRYILRTKRITNREFQDLCPDVHVETLRRDLADLTSKGLLIKVGDKKATYYIMKWIPDQETK